MAHYRPGDEEYHLVGVLIAQHKIRIRGIQVEAFKYIQPTDAFKVLLIIKRQNYSPINHAVGSALAIVCHMAICGVDTPPCRNNAHSSNNTSAGRSCKMSPTKAH
jgi:hypothetical protein